MSELVFTTPTAEMARESISSWVKKYGTDSIALKGAGGFQSVQLSITEEYLGFTVDVASDDRNLALWPEISQLWSDRATEAPQKIQLEVGHANTTHSLIVTIGTKEGDLIQIDNVAEGSLTALCKAVAWSLTNDRPDAHRITSIEPRLPPASQIYPPREKKGLSIKLPSLRKKPEALGLRLTQEASMMSSLLTHAEAIGNEVQKFAAALIYERLTLLHMNGAFSIVKNLSEQTNIPYQIIVSLPRYSPGGVTYSPSMHTETQLPIAVSRAQSIPIEAIYQTVWISLQSIPTNELGAAGHDFRIAAAIPLAHSENISASSDKTKWARVDDDIRLEFATIGDIGGLWTNWRLYSVTQLKGSILHSSAPMEAPTKWHTVTEHPTFYARQQNPNIPLKGLLKKAQASTEGLAALAPHPKTIFALQKRAMAVVQEGIRGRMMGEDRNRIIEGLQIWMEALQRTSTNSIRLDEIIGPSVK